MSTRGSNLPPGVPPELAHLHAPGGAIAQASAAQEPMLEGYRQIDRTLLPGLQACGLTIDSVDGLEGSTLGAYPPAVRQAVVEYAAQQIPLIWGRQELDLHARRNRVNLLCRQFAASQVSVSGAPLIALFETKTPESLAYTVADVMSRTLIKRDDATVQWLSGVLRGEKDGLFFGIDSRDESHVWMTKAAFALALARIEPSAANAALITPVFDHAPLEFGEALKRIALDGELNQEDRSEIFEFLDSKREWVTRNCPAAVSASFVKTVASVRKATYPGPRRS